MSVNEKKLKEAAENGRVEELWSVLRDNPGLNINWADNKNQWTALHFASMFGRFEVVKVLLAHPGINVNSKNRLGQIPFSFGCLKGQVSVVCVLLKDPRVNVTMADNNGCTPLWEASCFGHHEVVEWLIASGRDLGDIKNSKGKWDGKDYTALEIAKEDEETEETEIVALLERFIDNPAQTRHEIRVKLRVLAALAAEVFALTVFLCDDLLQLKPAATSLPAARFFTIATKLPIELQMILCHRAVGSAKDDSILSIDSEAAFKALATILLRSQSK